MPAPVWTPARAHRTLVILGFVGLVASGALGALWGTVHGWIAIQSPLLWAALAGFWGGAYCLIYARELRAVARSLGDAGALEATGVRIYWVRAPRTGGFGAAMEIVARSREDRFPVELSVFVNVNLLWALHVMGVRCSWSCKESGVLLLSPKRSRFLSGATTESLALPSQEEAVLRSLLKRPDGHEGGPDWGAPAGAHAKRAIEAVGAESWLFGPEQPFVAFEATEGAIEKFWSPVASRMVDLDVESALDILQVVRGFDRDAIAARSSLPTSSPPSARPSSPQP